MTSFSILASTDTTQNIIVYGINCYYPKEVIKIEDITTEKEKAELIVNTFNMHQPEKVHIYDIIENFLMDFDEF